jgi:hypothetical protein
MKSFGKTIALLSAVVAAAVLLAGCSGQKKTESAALPLEATAQGFGQYPLSQTMTVGVKVDESGRIVDLDVVHSETEGYGSTMVEPFVQSVLANNNFGQFVVDAKAGATRTKWALASAGQEAAGQVRGYTAVWPRPVQAVVQEPTLGSGDAAAVIVSLLVSEDGKMLAGFGNNPEGHGINPLQNAFNGQNISFSVRGNPSPAIPVSVSAGLIQTAIQKQRFDTADLGPIFDAIGNDFRQAVANYDRAAATDASAEQLDAFLAAANIAADKFSARALAAFVSAGNAALKQAK